MRKIGIVSLVLINIAFVSSLACYVFLLYENYYLAPTPIVKSVILDSENNVKIHFNVNEKNLRNSIYYIIKNENETPNTNDKWILTKNNKISFKLDKDTYYAYLKNEDDQIYKIDNIETLGKVTDLKVNKGKIYLALSDTYTPTLTYDYIGNIDTTVTWLSEDDSIASVDENGTITALKNGNTNVCAQLGGQNVCIEVVSTNLIVKRPNKYNSNKSYLSCGKYSKEENDLLDEILKDRIDTVGYKTRAGVVEAARFLALEFPYKIRYFSENGRGSTNGVDGEGRYYHVGLYLHSSRYKNIKKTYAGPKTWGCSLYSRPSHGYRSNGFDCSGFVSWVLLNGGFDVGDIGAGLASHKDLTDYGKRTKFNKSVVNSGVVKVGDLLSSGGVNGGHIAVIVGEDDKYYYVAESLWTPPNVAVVIIGYDKKTIFNRYYYVMLMDSYYKEDGNLTKLWY